MSMRDDIANTIAASLAFEGKPVSEKSALMAAARIEAFLWEHSSPCVWDGMRGRSLFMTREPAVGEGDR